MRQAAVEHNFMYESVYTYNACSNCQLSGRPQSGRNSEEAYAYKYTTCAQNCTSKSQHSFFFIKEVAETQLSGMSQHSAKTIEYEYMHILCSSRRTQTQRSGHHQEHVSLHAKYSLIQ